ncbi:MAG: 50S ribosomal protein L22 [Parcubacteria group bacterium]|nr:50S ribosomal protein L22 [Parcubacteria group bacterium]
MSTATATLQNYRHSPRKVRVVANFVRGKKVDVAIQSLKFLDKKAGLPLKCLIESAVSNAKNLNIDISNLFIKEIRVDGGSILYRRLPASRGRAHPMRKRTSHISVVLEPRVESAKSVKSVKSDSKTKTASKKESKAKIDNS